MEVVKVALKKRLSFSQKQTNEDFPPKKLYEVAYSKRKDDLPAYSLKPWNTTVTTACTGPNAGITKLDLHTMEIDTEENIAGVSGWNDDPTDKCNGISVSLYPDQPGKADTSSPSSEIKVGDPIADVYGAVARGNNTVLAIADGCGWGKKPRLAARCAVRAAIEYVLNSTTAFNKQPSSKTLLDILSKALYASHESIVKNRGTLTTLSITVVCELAAKTANGTSQWGTFTVSIGDSRVFVYCPRYQTLMEATIGSHSTDGFRVVSNSGGAIGPAIGSLPDLENLSFSFIPIAIGDVVILMTDGVSDNFLPDIVSSTPEVEVKREDDMGYMRLISKRGSIAAIPHGGLSGTAESLDPCCQVTDELLRTLQGHHDSLLNHVSAQTITSCLINFVLGITEDKRQFRTECNEKGIDIRARESQDPEFAEEVKKKVGKLDHATVLSYQIH